MPHYNFYTRVVMNIYRYYKLEKTKLGTFSPLVLGGIIENQNSDFVMLIELYCMTKSEF
jgi:hypothetical protein